MNNKKGEHMKSQKQNNQILLIWGFGIVIMGLSTFSWAKGTASSGGGDVIAAEFTAVGYQVVDILRSNPIEEVKVEDIDRVIRMTLVETKDRLKLEGREVDAINYPAEKRIEVSRKRWENARLDFKSRIVFAFHEYLAIAGISDEKYHVSHKLFEKEKRTWEVTCEPYADVINQLPSEVEKFKAYLKVAGVGDWFDAGLFVNNDGEWKSPTEKPQTLITLTNYEDQAGLGVVLVFGGFMPAYVKLPYGHLVDKNTPNLGVIKGIRTWVEDFNMDGVFPGPLELTCTYIKY